MSSEFPEGYVPFDRVHASFPEPTRLSTPDGAEWEVLHPAGPAPAVVFVHGGLGSLWNPYPLLDAFDGGRELVTYVLAGNGRSSSPTQQTLEGHVADLRGSSRPSTCGPLPYTPTVTGPPSASSTRNAIRHTHSSSFPQRPGAGQFAMVERPGPSSELIRAAVRA